MWANRSGIQGHTVRKIGLAWALTLPAAILLSAGLFMVGGYLIPEASASPVPFAASAEAPHAAPVQPAVERTGSAPR